MPAEKVEGWSIGAADTAIIMTVTKESSFMARLVKGESRREEWMGSLRLGLFHSLFMLDCSTRTIQNMHFNHKLRVNTENVDPSDNIESAKRGLYDVVS
jgi:hypothetical protein